MNDRRPELPVGTRMVRVEAITIGPRMRVASDVSELRGSIDTLGVLLAPIVIRTDGRLVAGAHRLEATKQLGAEWILATVADFDDAHARLAEIDENFTQHSLTVLELGTHAQARKDALREIGLLAASGGQPNRGDTVAPPETTAAMAERRGISERTLQRAVQIISNLPEDVVETIRELPIAGKTSELLALSKLTPEKQREVANSLLDGSASSVKSAVAPVAVADDAEADEDDDATWDDSDTRERLYPVRWEVSAPLTVPSGRMRDRNGKLMPRESYPTETRIEVIRDVAIRQRGLAGLEDMAEAVKQAILSDPATRADWVRLPSLPADRPDDEDE